MSDSAANSLAGFAVDAATGSADADRRFALHRGDLPGRPGDRPVREVRLRGLRGLARRLRVRPWMPPRARSRSVAGSPFGTGGLSPTTVGIDPTGKYLYVTNGATDNISAFSLDPVSGALTAVAGSPFAAGGTAPAFVGVDPTGHFAYAANARLDHLRVRHRRRDRRADGRSRIAFRGRRDLPEVRRVRACRQVRLRRPTPIRALSRPSPSTRRRAPSRPSPDRPSPRATGPIRWSRSASPNSPARGCPLTRTGRGLYALPQLISGGSDGPSRSSRSAWR
ncbi:MAG: beta-propeller fold lactonase family protein [Sphingobacterium sp.]|nr:beta-propeller fold lactonase family protein [Sphingobacterium sp.]